MHQQAHTFDAEDPPVIQEPIRPTLTPNPPPRARRTSGIRTGLVIAACLLVAVPVVMAMAANSSSSNQPLAAGASAAPDVTGHGGPPKGEKGSKGPGKRAITITAIDGSRVSLATEDGWTRTIILGPDAAVMRSDAKIAVTGLKVGDEVRIRQVRNADGSFTIVELRVVMPHLGGTVTVVGDTSLTLKLHDDSTRVITLTTDTTYRVGAKAGTRADVTKGADVDVEGTPGAGGAFTASTVHVKLPKLDGVVTGVSGSTITIMTHGPDGAKAIIHVGSATAYGVPGAAGVASGGLKDIAVGKRIKAEGTLRADGSLDATSVDVHGPKGDNGAPPAP
jgi:hypothetical protein